MAAPSVPQMVMLVMLWSLGGSIGWEKMVLLVILMFSFFLWSLYKYQEGMLYQPKAMQQFIEPRQNPPSFRDPGEHGMAYDNVYITTPDNLKLHCWFIRQAEPRNHPTLLFFHANAGNMGFRLANLKQLFESLHVNIFIVSYRGYGESQGEPSEEGLIIDAQTAWDHLTKRPDVDKDSLVVFGRSLGGAVAISLAAANSTMKGVILENTFSSISEMVDHLFPLLKYFKSYILRLKWESVKRIPNISVPILFLSGEQDEVVPKWHMQALHDAASACPKKTLQLFPAGMHNDTWLKGGIVYADTVRSFLSDVVPGYSKLLQGEGGAAAASE